MGFWGPDRQWSTGERKDRNMGEYDQLQDGARRSGGTARSAYLQRSLAFNPMEGLEDWAGGYLKDQQEQFGWQFRDMVGNAAGSGRQKTGFFQDDSKRMFQDFSDRTNRAIMGQAMNAQELDLRNTQGLGAYGQDMFQQQADLLTGAMDRSTAEDNARTSPAEMVGQVAGTALGFAVPGGGSLGGKLAQGAMNWMGGGGGGGGGDGDYEFAPEYGGNSSTYSPGFTSGSGRNVPERYRPRPRGGG